MKNFDGFSILAKTQGTITAGNNNFGSKVVSTDSYSQEDNISYLVDYEVNSATVSGAKNKGSVYLRGTKSQDGGYDSFKFILEKAVDFSDLDAQIILAAYEEAFKPKLQQPQQNTGSPVKKQYSKKADGNPLSNPAFIAGLVGN